jgi:hypothetical protein
MDAKTAYEFGSGVALAKQASATVPALVKAARVVRALSKTGKIKPGSELEKLAVSWGRAGVGALGGGATGAGIGAGLGMLGGPFAPLTGPVGAGIGGLIGGGAGLLSSLFGGGEDRPVAVGARPDFSPEQLQWLRARGFDVETPARAGAAPAAAARKPTAGGTTAAGRGRLGTFDPDEQMMFRRWGLDPSRMTARTTAMSDLLMPLALRRMQTDRALGMGRLAFGG